MSTQVAPANTMKIGDLQLRLGGQGLPPTTLTELVVSGLTSQPQLVQRGGRHYATDAGLCERQSALAATISELQTETAPQVFYYGLGEAVEDLVVRGLEVAQVLFGKQVSLPDVGLDLGGKVDAVVLQSDLLRLVEVKSCGKLPSRAKPHHHSQATLYAALLGLPSTVYYVSRSVATFDGRLLTAEFDLGSNKAQQREALFRAAYGHLAKLDNLIPPKPSHLLREADCGFCPFVSACWRQEPLPRVNPLSGQPWGQVDSTTNLGLVEEASQLVDQLLLPAEQRGRRLNLLRYLSRRGTLQAQAYLRGRNLEQLADAWQ